MLAWNTSLSSSYNKLDYMLVSKLARNIHFNRLQKRRRILSSTMNIWYTSIIFLVMSAYKRLIKEWQNNTTCATLYFDSAIYNFITCPSASRVSWYCFIMSEIYELKNNRLQNMIFGILSCICMIVWERYKS